MSNIYYKGQTPQQNCSANNVLWLNIETFERFVCHKT